MCLTAPSRTASLTGFGGIGKTSIAMHYARENQSEYAAILTVSLEGSSTARLNLSDSLISFLKSNPNFIKSNPNWLNDNPTGSEREKIIALLIDICLFFRGQILIIIDDVPFRNAAQARRSQADKFFSIIFPNNKIKKQLPFELVNRVHFLFTSRRPILIKKITNIPIKPMSKIDALALFISRFPDNNASDEEILKLVSKVLGRHPLSIVLVAAYAKNQKISSVSEIRLRLKPCILEAKEISKSSLPEYPSSLIASLNLSYSVLNNVEKALLLTLSMFRRDKLNFNTIRQACRKIDSFNTPTTAANLRRVLASNKGDVAAKNQLCKLGLLETHLRKEHEASSVQYRLHEIIFDYAQHLWVTTPQGEFYDSLRKLEIELTKGACKVVSAHVETKKLDFLDLETLVGLLIPISNPSRGLARQ